MTDKQKITALERRVWHLERALAPFVEFLEAFEAKPINGMDPDEIYGIHGGYYTEHGASLRWKHLRDAREALKQPVRWR